MIAAGLVEARMFSVYLTRKQESVRGKFFRHSKILDLSHFSVTLSGMFRYHKGKGKPSLHGRQIRNVLDRLHGCYDCGTESMISLELNAVLPYPLVDVTRPILSR